MTDVLDRLKPALADRYTIERELGRGGMAVVYLAHDLKHDRQVAVKVVKPDLAAVIGAERFLNEIKVTANLQHPHILPLHDSGEADGFLYYVMPYVEGESLRALLDRKKQLPIDRALEITKAVASALDHAHRHGVIHRDIKPENILLADDGQPLVADFGIALAVSEASGTRLTETGMSLGTPEYMSPEQATGDRQLEPVSDIYSLGAVLYEMLVGDPPYMGHTAQAIIARVMIDKPAGIRTVRDTVPAQMEQAVMKALAKVPADRFESAGAFVAAAGAAVEVEPIPTAEPQWMSRKRWRVGVTLVAGSAVVIVGALLTFLSGRFGRGPPQFIFSNIRQVTRAPEIEWDPVLSPDGSEVAYSAGQGLDWDIFVKDVGGGRPFLLTADRAGGQDTPRWTPDGRSLVFYQFSTGAYVVPRLGGPAKMILDAVEAPVWGVWDNRLAYIRRDSLLVRPLEGGEESFIAPIPPQPHSVAWSPDGARLAYVQGNVNWINVNTLGNVAPSSIWVVDLDGSEPVQVTDDTTLNVSPAWMPDGRHLLFVSDRDGGRDMYAVRLDAAGQPQNQPARVTTGLNPHSISVSADGSTVAYSQFSYRQNIWQIAIPETGSVSIAEAQPVTEGNQIVENHGLSRDGRWLAFDSNLEGNQDIYLMPAEGGEPRRVTSDPGIDLSPDFSPDGAEIVFYSIRRGARELFLISTDGREETRLTDGPGDDLHPSFSPDGLRIAFSRMGVIPTVTSAVYVMSRDSLGGEWDAPKLITPDTNSRFTTRWSPDGSRIATYSQNRIWIVSLQGEERLLFHGAAVGLRGSSFPDWSVDGRLIYFWARDSTGTRSMYAIPIEGGTPREVVRLDDPTKEVTLYYSLGADKVYLSVNETDSDIYVMDLEMK